MALNTSSPHIIWLKNPLAILAKNAEGGLVIEGQKIIELVPQGQQPTHAYSEVMECSDLVILPGSVSYTHLTLPTIYSV